MKKDNRPIVMGYSDAIDFLKISNRYFDKVVAQWKIPYQQTSSWKIFFKMDIETFNKERREKAKTDNRIKIR